MQLSNITSPVATYSNPAEGAQVIQRPAVTTAQFLNLITPYLPLEACIVERILKANRSRWYPEEQDSLLAALDILGVEHPGRAASPISTARYEYLKSRGFRVESLEDFGIDFKNRFRWVNDEVPLRDLNTSLSAVDAWVSADRYEAMNPDLSQVILTPL